MTTNEEKMMNEIKTLQNHFNRITELETKVSSIRARLNPITKARQAASNLTTEVNALTNRKKQLKARSFATGEDYESDIQAADKEIAELQAKIASLTVDEETAAAAEQLIQSEIDPILTQINGLNALTAGLQREAMLAKIERIKNRYLNSVEDVKQAYLELVGAGKFYDDHWRAGFSNVLPLAFAPTLEFALPIVAHDATRQLYIRIEPNDLNAYKASFKSELSRDGMLFY